MIDRIRARVVSLQAARSWLRLALGIALNLLILAVVVAVYLSIFLIARPELAEGGAPGALVAGTIFYWGAMLVPTIIYLLILEFAVEGSSLTRRLWALGLSPVCAVPLFIAAMGGTHESLGRWLLEALSLPLAYGAVVRLHRYSQGPRPGARSSDMSSHAHDDVDRA